MIVDSRTLPDGETITTDIAIVGAGAAGITIARDLIDAPLRVALIESGGFTYDPVIQDLYIGEVVGRPFPDLDVARLRFFGGSTNHWEGYCRPLDPIDFEVRPHIPNSGWPFGAEALAPYYARAQEVCELGPLAYEAADWTEGATAFDFDGTGIRSGVFQTSPPTRFGETYRQELAQATNVTTYLHANVVDIDTEPLSHRVTGLRLARLADDGSPAGRLEVRTRIAVLAAGGIETPRILLNCRRQNAEGLGNQHGLVGRYFMDHPIRVNARRVVFTDQHPSLAFYTHRTVAGTPVHGFFGFTPELQARERLLNCGLMVDPTWLIEGDRPTGSLKHILGSLREGRIPDDFMHHLGQVAANFDDIVRRVYHNKLSPQTVSFATRFWCECPPDPDSRLTLSDETDALGLHRVRLDWRLPEAEITHSFRRAHELLAEAVGRNGLGRVQVDAEEPEEDLLAGFESSHHHMGATRMHPDPRRGVVDADGQVHGVPNLYIAGSSVFPTYGHANPTLTIVALALRLADHIKKTAV